MIFINQVEDTKKSIDILNLMGSIIFTDEVQAEVPFQVRGSRRGNRKKNMGETPDRHI